MMLDGYSIADKKIITFDEENSFDTQDQIQPNGIDLRVNKIYRVQGRATIPRDGRAGGNFVVGDEEMKDGYWNLSRNDVCLFYVDFLEKIAVPGGYCGIIHTRSSLIRSGVDVVAGLFDSGFQGQLGAVMRVYNDITIEYGAKLAQCTLHESKFGGMLYSGRYQGTNSQTAITHGT